MHPATPPPILVDHLPQQHRFVAQVDGLACVVDYRLHAGVMDLVHTEVPARLQGRGIAAVLVQAALDHAQAHGLKVRPVCSYVRSHMRRHPATQHLLA